MLKHILERCQFGDHCDLKRIRFHGGTSNRLGGAILSPRAREMRRMMLVYFLIGPLWPGCSFTGCRSLPPSTDVDCLRTPLVSKRRDAPYRSGRAGAGLKS